MNQVKQRYKILLDSAGREKLLKYISSPSFEYMAFDIETNGLEVNSSIIGFSVSVLFDEGFYVPLRIWDKNERILRNVMPDKEELDYIKRISRVFSTKKLICHNGSFDLTLWNNTYDINLIEALYADTLLMKHTIDETKPFALKKLIVKYYEEAKNNIADAKNRFKNNKISQDQLDDILCLYDSVNLDLNPGEAANQAQINLKASIKANGGSTSQTNFEMYKADLEVLGRYAAEDSEKTLRLFDFLDKLLTIDGLDNFFYNQEVMPLYKKCTIPMKMNGLLVDVEYFKKLEKELESAIIESERKVFGYIKDDIEPFIKQLVDKAVDVTKTGLFAKKALQLYNILIPSNKKTGKPTLAKSALQSLLVEYPGHEILEWLINDRPLSDDTIQKVKREIFVEDNPDQLYIFNLNSSDHLRWLIFDCYNQEPDPSMVSRKTGVAKVDQDVLELYSDLPFVKDLLEYKTNQKILNTYIKPILNKHIDGWVYPSMKQHGTTSGRYACGSDKEAANSVAKDINFQTLPRDDKRIKKGFIAPKGYKIVNADFSSLEPRCFSLACGDERLIELWNTGNDFYSTVAIDVLGLMGVSANPKSKNFLKTIMPEMRQLIKQFALAVPYGANAWRISKILKKPVEECQTMINNYLESYPGLKDYMDKQEKLAIKYGYIKSRFGRVRHIPRAKEIYDNIGNAIFNKRTMSNAHGEWGEKLYYEFRNLINNARNFPIQSMAAHITNAAMIKLADQLKKNNLDAYIGLQVHDEVTLIVREDHAELAKKLLQDAMENNKITKQIPIPIVAEPKIADNFADAK